MKKKSTQKIWDYNKRVFHGCNQWMPGARQLHHIMGKDRMPFRVCPHFFQPVTIEQHNDWAYLENLRDMYHADGLKCLKNYSKEKQCEKMIFRECSICAVMLNKEIK